MKRILLVAAAVGTLAAAAPALAQPYGGVNGWQTINARQAQLDRRIDMGVQNGSLTRPEAQRLRGEFRMIADLEARYRSSGGLDARERADLDRRFDVLSQRIRWERADNQDRGDRGFGRGPGQGQGRDDAWNINARQAQLDRRIERNVRSGALTPREAGRLRAEFRAVADLESRYRATGGLDMRERADLDRRFDVLESRLRTELADRDFRWEDGYRFR